MVELYGQPFRDLIDRLRLESAAQDTLFDLPRKKWHLPPTGPGAPDFGVEFHGRRTANPLGPASGPQTQMAQNLVLSWLGGSRILELKTVQIDDELVIGRPCIDATNVGYNIEFSQELPVQESLNQYVQGAMLIHMLRSAPGEFGDPFGGIDLAGPLGDTIYDMSIGYDLKGIRSPKVCDFIRGFMDARETVEHWRAQIPGRLGALRDLDYPTQLSGSITLSTFHGCPADEIERICTFLLTELDVDCIVKMNPPMLGPEKLEHLLHDVLGFTEVTVNPSAYTSGLAFDDGVQMCDRLYDLAGSRGRSFGAKFSNTLEVTNHRDFFSSDEKVMYLSGVPLHVITITLADEFRRAFGRPIPISFAAGVDRKNFANLVACGFTPITTCTDLLKPGGYGRLPGYLDDLAKDMARVGAATVGDYILDARGHREAAGGDPVAAAQLNSAVIVEETQADPRYAKPRNSTVPKRIDSRLVTFDCLTCYKCIPVCPNDANFLYVTPQVDLAYRDLEVSPDGAVAEVGDEKAFTVERTEQIANYADFCNHCGNCDTFCPEYDGPFIKKPSFFGSRTAFDDGADHDGFLLEGETGSFTLHGRIESRPLRLQEAPGGFIFHDGTASLALNGDTAALAPGAEPPPAAHRVDMGLYHTMVTLLRGITDPSRVHQVNTRLLAGARGR